MVMTYIPHPEILEHLIAVYSLVGFVISLLLVFRTNTAYDRWWEGRKKWGALVNDTRNFAIKISTIISDKEEFDFFKRMIPNFVFATREHLREGVNFEDLDLSPEELKLISSKEHVPNAISQELYRRAHQLKSEGKISEEEFIVLDKNMNALLDSLGACERIKHTPIPYSYSLFLKKFIFLYVTTLPFAFANIFGFYSAIIATFIFYVLASMEILAEEIEDPFGTDANDLPTDALSEKIKSNVQEILTL